jgi:hypothetical protein
MPTQIASAIPFGTARMSISASSTSTRTVAGRPSSRVDGSHTAQTDLQPTGRRRGGDVPWGFAGMLILVLAIEGAVARRWLDFSDPVSLSWRFSADAARVQAPGRDLLCLGDSLAKHGVIPALIQRQSGLRTTNLAAARAPTLMTYFLLRRALDAGAHPSAILINTKQAVLIGGPDYNAAYWPAVLSPRECLELGRVSRRPETAAAALMGCLLPSLRSRLEIRSNLMAALRGEVDPLHDINRVLWRNWTVNDGANVASFHSGYRGELSSEIQANLHPDAFYVDRSNAEGLECLLRLAAQRKIPVYWLLTPLSPGLQAWRDRSGAEARFEEWVRLFQSRYPQVVTVLDARHVVSDPSMFIDATHLAGRGAIALSHAVGMTLKNNAGQPLSASHPRWIVLDPMDSDPQTQAELNLEDVDQSKRILQIDTKGRTLNAR